ncbi:MAG TPA: 1-deoxy-D-xylulose-5-phosphate reductoisomerase [Thermoanaerobaculia bacterium]|nr:1-deoxy-D-xylulose-5-phosphate reductoisomerase [Thermoanaerobaculia bacterium]
MRLAILGATGSIGTSTLRVVASHPERFEVVGLAAGASRLEELARQAAAVGARWVVVPDRESAARLSAMVPARVRVESGADALAALAAAPEVERVVAAMVGCSGLRPVAAALEAGKDVALANKEALVAAGPLLLAIAERSGARILPVDSEPVALDQVLRCGERAEIERLVLTASGGPFLDRPLETWGSIEPHEALAHPTWSMGPKISVDSATLMNKGLELIEAAILFGVPEDQIEIVVHPQSLVHSLVEFRDGSWIAQLGPKDMTLPIQYALTYPERVPCPARRLGLAEIGALEFRELDGERFPSVELARSAARAGGSVPAVLSAANETAVAAFLAGRLPFPSIVPLVGAVLEAHVRAMPSAIEEVLEWDRWAREAACARLPA